jgi:hypothetical protein
MDDHYIGSLGADFSGQYAVEINKYDNYIYYQTSKDIDTVMDYLLSSVKIDRFENIIIDIGNGSKTYLLKMMVPIINLRTGETVGIVGCFVNIGIFQVEVELNLRNNYLAIAGMAIYSNDGMILCHFIPERIGKMLGDADIEYAEYLQEAKYAVQYGHTFYCNVYSPILLEKIEFYMTPFNISNSDTTWTLMTLVPESYLKKRSFFSIR